MPILTADAQSLLQRRVGKAIAKTRDDASLAWKAIKIDVVKRGVSGGSIEKTLLGEMVQSGLKDLVNRIQADAVEVLEAAGLSITADVIPEITALVTPLLDNMERGMSSEFGGMRGFGDRLKAQLASGLEDVAMLNKVRSTANSRRQTAASSMPTPLPAPQVPSPSEPASLEPRRFRVSLSFAGEHRDYVKQVADHLVAALGAGTVLYDKYFESEFSRPGLDVHLPDLYRKQSDLVVVFISKEYDTKRWCGLEWRSIRGLIADREYHRLMFLRFDNSEVEGILPGDGYAWIGEGADQRPFLEIAHLILERLGIEPPSRSGDSSASGEDWLGIAKSTKEQWIRVNAVGRIEAQSDLQGIADQEGDGEVRRAAVRRLVDQDLLLRFARTDPYPRVRMAAAALLVRPEDIESIRSTEKNPDVLLALSKKAAEGK